MKKCLVVISVMCLALLAGCGGSKVLTCKISKTQMGIKISQVATVKFDGDKVDTMSQKINIVLPDTYKSLINTFVSTYQKQYEKQFDGSSVKASKVGDSEVEVSIDTNFKKLTDAQKKSSGMTGAEDYETNRKQLEKAGYTCE